jgi:hypothetical protein
MKMEEDNARKQPEELKGESDPHNSESQVVKRLPVIEEPKLDIDREVMKILAQEREMEEKVNSKRANKDKQDGSRRMAIMLGQKAIGGIKKGLETMADENNKVVDRNFTAAEKEYK